MLGIEGPVAGRCKKVALDLHGDQPVVGTVEAGGAFAGAGRAVLISRNNIIISIIGKAAVVVEEAALRRVAGIVGPARHEGQIGTVLGDRRSLVDGRAFAVARCHLALLGIAEMTHQIAGAVGVGNTESYTDFLAEVVALLALAGQCINHDVRKLELVRLTVGVPMVGFF